MCGRFAQYRPLPDYAAGIGHAGLITAVPENNWTPRFNVPPGSEPWVMHAFDENPAFLRLRWGYRPSWAADKGMAPAINARIEKATTGRYFRHLFAAGRVIVPADGWYEWTGEKGHKQPWHIQLTDGDPMYFAAITNFRPDRIPKPDDGFVIVTAASDAGMVDVHDRRPVVLTGEDALLWMDNSLPAEQAEHLARAMSLPGDAFEWYKVDTAVNRVGNDAPQLIAPVAPSSQIAP